MVFQNDDDYSYQMSFSTEDRYNALPEADKQQYQSADKYSNLYLSQILSCEWPRMTTVWKEDGTMEARMV